jgi:HEAT repeat protein
VVGDTQHLEQVRERLDDEDEAVRSQAERALRTMGARLDVDPELWAQG